MSGIATAGTAVKTARGCQIGAMQPTGQMLSQRLLQQWQQKKQQVEVTISQLGTTADHLCQAAPYEPE